MIVDVHVHALPHRGQDVLPEVRRQCRVNGCSTALVSIGGALQHYPDSEQVRRSNDECLDFARRSAGLGRFLVYLNPQNPDWRDELQRGIDAGAVGVKLLSSFKDEAGSLDNAVELIREVGRRGLSLLTHTWQKTQGNERGEITLVEFAALAEACPGARMVAAHSGGNWRHSIGVLRDRLTNAHLECSGYYPERGLVEALVGDVGAERVLFGSDLAGRTQASQIAKVALADISAEQKEMVLWKNAARVFGLEDLPPEPSAPLRPLGELPDFNTDHFCFAGRWPFHEGPSASPEELDGLLGAAGIDLAYTGHLSTLLRQDLEHANNEFLSACQGAGRLAPLASLSPRAHNWRSTLGHLKSGFAGVIVFPYAHNWQLDAPEHAPFFRALADARLPVWINCALADDRTRHSGLDWRLVRTEELANFCASAPANDYVFQGLHAGAAAGALEAASDTARFRFDVSKLTDICYTLDEFVGKYGRDCLVMGSEFPLRHIEEVRWTARRI
jgi:predicted TIM-barrel fold metal-dependent hydrolase